MVQGLLRAVDSYPTNPPKKRPAGKDEEKKQQLDLHSIAQKPDLIH
jgi:hypothetical protein